MNKTIIFFLSIFVIVIMNFILAIKALSYLKPEYESKKFKLLLNFAWPKKEYFDVKGWRLWIFMQLFGFIELILFLI